MPLERVASALLPTKELLECPPNFKATLVYHFPKTIDQSSEQALFLQERDSEANTSTSAAPTSHPVIFDRVTWSGVLSLDLVRVSALVLYQADNGNKGRRAARSGEMVGEGRRTRGVELAQGRYMGSCTLYTRS